MLKVATTDYNQEPRSLSGAAPHALPRPQWQGMPSYRYTNHTHSGKGCRATDTTATGGAPEARARLAAWQSMKTHKGSFIERWLHACTRPPCHRKEFRLWCTAMSHGRMTTESLSEWVCVWTARRLLPPAWGNAGRRKVTRIDSLLQCIALHINVRNARVNRRSSAPCPWLMEADAGALDEP